MTPTTKLVLALNAGSSSLKASILHGETTTVSFLAERLMTVDASLHISPQGQPKMDLKPPAEKIWDHAGALSQIIDYLKSNNLLQDVVAVGHRVVHGGTIFSDSALITDETLAQMASCNHLAPLHNPHNIAGIDAMRLLLQDIPNVAVFDTSFHASIPVHAYTYPLPLEYRQKDMRKFGFHGTSVRYVSQKATEIIASQEHDDDNNKKTNKGRYNMVVCHLGNGASVTAVSNNQSMDTSMGFTPLSGLMMGTRCGDVDPSLVSFACHQLDKTVDDVLNDFNKKSGLKGMIASDGENDMRELLKRRMAGDPEASLAVDMFVYHLAQHIAQCLVALDGPMDALVFTAGIGEHSSEIRSLTIAKLQNVNPNLLTLHAAHNQADGQDSNGIISEPGSWPLVLVIATDEEVMIAKECIRLVNQ